MIIGVTGSQCAGKDTAVDYLASKGFQILSLSTEVREEATRRGLELTKTNLQNLGNELRKSEGDGALVIRLMKKMRPANKYAVVGIRNPGEIFELKNSGNFFLISIDAPQELRFARMMQRSREGDPRNWEDFLKIDARDKGAGEGKSGQQVLECMELANFNLFNDGDIGAAHEKIKRIIEEIDWLARSRH